MTVTSEQIKKLEGYRDKSYDDLQFFVLKVVSISLSSVQLLTFL